MKSRGWVAWPLVAVCTVLADCSSSATTSETTSETPPTAFALLRLKTNGTLDTNLSGGTGIVTTDVDPARFDFGLAVAVQPADNKILAAGSSGLAGEGVIAVVRYNPDGALDTSFGSGGIVRTSTPAGWTSASASAIAVQPDNKILVAALAFAASTATTGIALLRYTSSGALDPAFGTQGVVTVTIGSGFSTDTCGLALQPNGKIVVVGASSNGKIVLARYDTGGVLDLAFGSGGITTTSLGVSTASPEIGMSPVIGLQSNGKIVVASIFGSLSAPPVDQVVLRYNTNGTLDTGFGPSGANGIVTTDVGGSTNFANALAVLADDKIVVAGHAFVDFGADTSAISLVRYNADGTLDTGFGSNRNGIVTTNLSGKFDNALGIALQTPLAAATNILVSGNTGSGGFSQAIVLRYTPTGGLDPMFGFGGVTAVAPVGPSTISSGNAVALQPNVGIVVVGYD